MYSFWVLLFIGDKHSDFGKQRCWTSIGWGMVATLSGWLVDYFSHDEVQKNYTPLSYLIFSFMVLNLIFASNIKVWYMFGDYILTLIYYNFSDS